MLTTVQKKNADPLFRESALRRYVAPRNHSSIGIGPENVPSLRAHILRRHQSPKFCSEVGEVLVHDPPHDI